MHACTELKNHMLSLRILGLSALTLVSASAAAAPDAGEATLKRFSDGVETFQAHFDQVQKDEQGRVTARSSGEFWLQRPTQPGAMGKFRWAYEKPYKQVTICDGTKLWHYDPDLNQVTVRAAKDALAGSPAELLSQRGSLSTLFSASDGGTEDGVSRLKLEPKAKTGDFKSIEMSIDKNGAPVSMRLADQIGGMSEITFSSTATNAKIGNQQFQFTPPKGTEIVNGDGPVTKPLD